MNTRNKILAVAMLAAALAACGGGDSSVGGTGTLSLGVTDAPVDGAMSVVVKFIGVEVKPENGNAATYDINPPKSVDLIALSGGGSAALLDSQSVPAGRYEWMRLLVASQQNTLDSYIQLSDGTTHPLYIPSGDETGLKLIRGFTVAAGGHTDFVADFDLRKSIVAPPGQSPSYFLKPVVRIVDNLQVGTISGTVASSLITTACTPFVYVFTGSNAVPDDLDSAAAPDVDPLISVPVTLNNTTGNYEFLVSFVEPGSYTLAFTCDGTKDTPDAEETLVFASPVNVTVTANQTVTVTL